MKTRIKIWIILFGILIGGIAYWRTPYSDMNLMDDGLWLLMGTMAFVAALVSFLVFKEKPWLTGLLICLGVAISIMLRVLYEVSFWDSTSHNLWPFEIIISILQALPMSIAGAYVGNIFSKRPEME